MKIRLEELTKIFTDKQGRDTIAVDKLNVEIEDGKLIGLLGPSGCGKSTTLYMIAGLHKPTSGRIYFDSEDVTDLSPEKRGIGLVFQNYALYPHMTILENILFPLKNLKVPYEEALDKANKIAELVGIASQLNKKPGQLSGGQQQRVAIARALVKEPRVLLLDEPLSNLDARLRLQMREEIKRIQKETGITTVFVTHDQEEAMSICDSIVLMEYGVEQQRGVPQEIYDEPNNLFVANFLGTPPISLYNATVSGGNVVVNNEAVVAAPNVTSKVKTWEDIKENYPITYEDNSNIEIKVAGSKKLAPYIQKLADEFTKISGNPKFSFNMQGSEDAFDYVQGPKRDKKALRADLGVSSRALRENERGVKRFITPLFMDSPILVVNKQNELNDISEDNLKKILKGKIKTWENIIDETTEKNARINIYTTDTKSGARNFLFDRLGLYISDKFKVSRKIIVVDTEEEVLERVKNDKAGLGVLSYSTYLFANNSVTNDTTVKFSDVKTNEEKEIEINMVPSPDNDVRNSEGGKALSYKERLYQRLNRNRTDFVENDVTGLLDKKHHETVQEERQYLEVKKAPQGSIKSLETESKDVKVVTIEGQVVNFETIKDSRCQFANRGVLICRSNPFKPSEQLAVAFAAFLKTQDAIDLLKHDSKVLIQPKEYILGVRPEGYEINANGRFTLNLDYYESIGRDISIICRHPKALNKTFRLIANDRKQLAQLDEKNKKVKVNLYKGKYYLFEKETGERVL